MGTLLTILINFQRYNNFGNPPKRAPTIKSNQSHPRALQAAKMASCGDGYPLLRGLYEKSHTRFESVGYRKMPSFRLNREGGSGPGTSFACGSLRTRLP